VYGSSAGAINAAYFLAGQARLGTTVYYEDLEDRTLSAVGSP
jgi:predicted acylesterase/phospholipase RssA